MISELSSIVALPKIRLSSTKKRSDIFGHFCKLICLSTSYSGLLGGVRQIGPPHKSRIDRVREDHLGKGPGTYNVAIGMSVYPDCIRDCRNALHHQTHPSPTET